MEEFEPDFGVFFFVVAGFVKDGGDLLVAVFFSLTGVVLVSDRGLGFTGKGGF